MILIHLIQMEMELETTQIPMMMEITSQILSNVQIQMVMMLLTRASYSTMLQKQETLMVME